MIEARSGLSPGRVFCYAQYRAVGALNACLLLYNLKEN